MSKASALKFEFKRVHTGPRRVPTRRRGAQVPGAGRGEPHFHTAHGHGRHGGVSTSWFAFIGTRGAYRASLKTKVVISQ